MLWLSGVVITLAWGAGAFGSPYPWAYNPLLLASAVLGMVGLWRGFRSRSTLPATLVSGFLLILVATGCQLLPLSPPQLATLSPHAQTILNQQDLQYSIDTTVTHPISIDPSRTRLGLAFFGAFALLLLGTGHGLQRKSANRLVSALVILSVILATIGIVQRATFNGKIYGFWEPLQPGLPFGPFVNRNHFAGWMLMALPVALGYFLALVSRGVQNRQPSIRNLVLWFSTEQASRALLTGFAIAVIALSLVLTMSRSGMIAGVAAILVAGITASKRQSGVSRRALTIAYLVILVAAVMSWVGLDQISTRFAEVDPTSIYERPAIWADTIRIAKDYWLTGTGLNTYGVSTLYYQTSAPGQHLREAHSDYLQLAAEGGLLLCIPIAITIAAFVWEVRKRFRQDVGSIWWIRFGAVIALLAIAVQSIGEFSLQMPGNAALFAVIAGIAIHDGRRM
jgi:O-antigen ligase